MNLTAYYDKDADLSLIRGRKVAVIGYGSQGHAQAQNLRDEGISVVVAELPGTPNHDRAVADGFRPVSAGEAAASADIVHLLVPDDVQRKVYEQDIKDHMTPGNALVFSHGFNIRFGLIRPPDGIDVYMVAPKSPGRLVRKTYVEGTGVPALVAVAQDVSGRAFDRAVAHACAIGAGRAGILPTTFGEETETDLFGEQAVLCGGVSELIRAGFDTLTEAGYHPEIAYFECLHELKLIVDLIQARGIAGMRNAVSETAQFGDLTRGRRIIPDETRQEMRRILGEIRDGRFAREWLAENDAGRPEFKRRKEADAAHPIEAVGRRLRSMMSWMDT